MKSQKAFIPLDVASFLNRAIQASKLLIPIHQQGRIHGKLTPFSFLQPFSPKKIFSPDLEEGDLPYASPERMGRIKGPVDVRADLYSLGAIFYEWLVGQAPFPTQNPEELLHAHAALTPLSPSHWNSSIPEALSALVMKLLSKEREERPFSALILKAELEKYLHQWEQKGFLNITARFQWPQKLYGLESQKEDLKKIFEESAQGALRICWIRGAAGAGKSSLVNEFSRSLHGEKAYFCHGKFDPFRKEAPYAAWVQALRSLIKQVLAQDLVDPWRDKIRKVLGINARLMIDLIPELEALIGPHKAPPKLPALEAQNRFNLTLLRFIGIFAEKNKPLVLFLDDLQWADPASLHLIGLLESLENEAFFLIAASREGEGTPLTGRFVHSIHLTSLTVEHLTSMVADTFQFSHEMALAVGQMVWIETKGNPFFARQLLQSLLEKGAIYPTIDGSWILQTDKLGPPSEDVMVLLAERVKNLSEDCQKTLAVASCLGSSLDPELLARIQKKSPEVIQGILHEAVDAGLLWPLKEGYHRWAHDRIHQSLNQLLSQEESEKVHAEAAFLLQEIPDRDIFSLVDHLHRGGPSVLNSWAPPSLARLHHEAGMKAKSSGALESALDFFIRGLSYLNQSHWQSDDKLCLMLNEEAAECALLCANFEVMEERTETIFKMSPNLLDKIAAYETKILAHRALNEPLKSVALGLKVLAELKESLPRNPQKFSVFIEFLKLKKDLKGRKPTELIHLPEMVHPRILATMKILSSVSTAAYLSAPLLFPLILLRFTRLSLRYGNGPVSALGYAAYGLFLTCILRRVEEGWAFARLALELAKQHPEISAKVKVLAYGMVHHWRENAELSIQPMQEAVNEALESGDFEFVSGAAIGYLFFLFYLGKNLNDVEEEIKKMAAMVKGIRQMAGLNHIHMLLEVVHRMRLGIADPIGIEETYFNEENVLPLYEKANDETATALFHMLKLKLHYLFHRHREAHGFSQQVREKIPNLIGQGVTYQYYFYDSMNALALISQSLAKERKILLKRVKKNQEKLKRWARHCPGNLLHPFELVEAERMRVLGKEGLALGLYESSIRRAKESNHPNIAALACERAALFHGERGRKIPASAYLSEAIRLYRMWGAESKVAHLEGAFAHLLTKKSQAHHAPSPFRSDPIDWASIQKAVRALSGEVVLDDLVESLMALVIRNAGAQRGLLFLEDGEGWSLQGEEKGDFPQSILRYVQRTGEEVVLDKACEDPRFSSDSFIREKETKSLLCLPLLHLNKRIGYIYLENNLASGVFASERLDVVRFLSSQAALSLENARLYAGMKTAVPEENSPFLENQPSENWLNLLVDLMTETLLVWERFTQKGKIELAEESGIWRIHVDGGRLRVRAMDRYLSLNKLPQKPRWRDVVQTTYFVLSHCPLEPQNRTDLEGRLNRLLQALHP